MLQKFGMTGAHDKKITLQLIIKNFKHPEQLQN